MDLTFFYLSIGSIALIAISIPLAIQKIKPNRLYGVRTRLTLNNKAIWYKINRIYGLWMISSAFCFFLLSISLGNWREGSGSENMSITLFIIEVSVPVIMTFIKLTQLKKE